MFVIGGQTGGAVVTHIAQVWLGGSLIPWGALHFHSNQPTYKDNTWRIAPFDGVPVNSGHFGLGILKNAIRSDHKPQYPTQAIPKVCATELLFP